MAKMCGGSQAPFKRGRIVRIKVTDFVTYDSVECFPGEGLNMIIGPNGSGKSTLLSAIVLGLGGNASIIGRSNKLIDYIKTGAREATIEIELVGDGRNIVFKRTISTGKHTFSLNGRPSSQKEFDTMAASLNIQIDNLCQVLPQDRVQDFARMNKQELLESTLKAVGKEGMSEIHLGLKKLQDDLKSWQSQLIADKEKYESEKSRLEKLDSEVKKVEKRRAILSEVEGCKKKLEVMQYSVTRDQLTQVTNKKKTAEENVKNLEKKLGPYQQEIEKAENELKTTKQKYRVIEGKVQSLLTDVVAKRSNIDEIKESILEAERTRDREIRDCERIQNEIEKVEQNISRLRNDVGSLKVNPEGDEKRKKVLELEIENLRRQVEKAQRDEMQADEKVSEVGNDFDGASRRLQLLADVKSKRMATLESLNRDTHQAAQWINQNRGRFQSNVFLPMIVELDVTDQRVASYVESAIGFKDLIAFTCESKADLAILVEELRKTRNLRINVLHSSGEVQDRHLPMSSADLRNTVPGMYGYLGEFVSGPQAVLNYLCQSKGFHKIPVGSAEVDDDRIPSGFSLYFTGKYRTHISKSSYSGETIRSTDTIPNARFLTNSVDQRVLDELKGRISHLKKMFTTYSQEAASCRAAREKFETERHERRNTLAELNKVQQTIQTVKFHLVQKEKELQKWERKRKDPDVTQEECRKKMKTLVEKLMEAQEPLYSSLKAVDRCNQDYALLEMEVFSAQYNLDGCKERCKAEQKALNKAKDDLDQIGNEYAEVKQSARALLTALERKAGMKVDEIKKQKWFLILPNTIDELESQIQEKQAYMDMLGGSNDREIMKEYENKVASIKRIEKNIETKKTDIENIEQTMNDKESKWLTELNELVTKINRNFSRYFMAMRCVGEVCLFTGNNEHDYKNFGLRICVKFRDEDDLMDLDGHLQSGGERAVSTAIYMLSLQELTPVPFRLVDEINQGMDPVNERRVYELILESVSQPNTPQYFLLTPKLLRNLSYSNNVTVMCVFNSAGAPSHKYWNLEKFIARQRQLNGES